MSTIPLTTCDDDLLAILAQQADMLRYERAAQQSLNPVRLAFVAVLVDEFTRRARLTPTYQEGVRRFMRGEARPRERSFDSGDDTRDAVRARTWARIQRGFDDAVALAAQSNSEAEGTPCQG